MSKINGTFKLSANYEPLIQAPLDARELVDTESQLYNADTWDKDGNNVYIYPCMTVKVKDTNKIYMFVGDEPTLAKVTQKSNWKDITAPTEKHIENLTLSVLDNLVVGKYRANNLEEIDLGVTKLTGANCKINASSFIYINVFSPTGSLNKDDGSAIIMQKIYTKEGQEIFRIYDCSTQSFNTISDTLNDFKELQSNTSILLEGENI